MAHREQHDYVAKVKQKYSQFFSNVSVIEIGSYNINGSVREFFSNCFYIGLDVAPGPCVDVVCLGHEYAVPDNMFDVVISTECFEHDPYWQKTFANMIRICKSGGLILFTCATTGRAEHGTLRHRPGESLTVNLNWDYYQNITVSDFAQFDMQQLFFKHQFEVNDDHHDLYFYGIKR